ncbi:Polyketide synthase-nonribosomal peptide synthetase [Colletotrichum gloeosporioides]|uniref:Polyketide synthase-nonribosomal peptide synthetase n=1 Tax=Colletotrichum gloeosporioides TaxID=474922 RepID=A0A8H4FFJ3_COLGL|nr:Polyketide synthase-nonribosomal peptide synthetase [Colletotrichum gloeosporioides]KAF3799174.1 Polyketide synthase-nonribosomal peptide synthetase [Colletotrichum gloeosporioides]
MYDGSQFPVHDMNGDKRKDSIAIVGIGCRLPGNVSSPSQLWDLLSEPVDLSAPIPPSRFSASGFYHEDAAHHGTTNTQRSYFLDDQDIQTFDAAFFNIGPREAEAMDPQACNNLASEMRSSQTLRHRLLLEVVYEGLEDAGIPLQATSGSSTAAYVGLMSTDWQDLQLRDIDGAPRYLVTGGARSIASNRLSYFFNWHGPSETIDTACSSSLVALHHAVHALRSGEASMAVAAGTNLLLAPDMYVMTSNLNMLSPTGKCQMWSSAADGYSRGEGVACVILKTVPQALHDGDRIYAVVRETGVNQDGRTTGITMPSSTAQTELIRETYAKAGLDLRKAEDRCQFFEAHGTGTPAGDPIEAQAIWDAFFTTPTNQSAPPEQLYVGSVKTVVGHLEGCAGLAGVIKACLGLHQGFIPSNLHLGTPNPKIAPMLGPGKLLVPTEHLPWPEPVKSTDPAIQIPRRASVNSFGFGGTNAHAILESFDAIASKGTVHKAPKTTKQPPVNIVISAAKEPSLASLVSRYADYLEAHPDLNLDSLAWTTQKRRTRLEYGISFTGSSRSILVKQMRTSVKAYHDGSHIGVSSTTWNSGSEGPEILGVFTGQGAQWATMGAKLLDACPAFAQSIARLENALFDTMAVEEELSGSSKWSLSTELRAPIGESRIAEAEFAQPLSTAVQVALVDTLRSVGVNFSAVIGHSSGELAAAYTVGCISAADAIRMAYYRGRFSKLARSPHDTDGDQGGKGGMLAAGISWDDAQILCSDSQLGFRDHVCVAANNAPSSVTLSGDLHKLREMQTLLRDRNVPVQMLRVDKAYHSPHMRVSGDAYREALSRCRLDGPQPTSNRPTCVWISSVHTDWEPISNANLHNLPQSLNSAQYWVENMLAPVRFRDALERLAKLKKVRAGLEVGPHPALRRQVVDTLTVSIGELAYRGTLARGVDERDSLSSVYGFLWERGINIDFDATSVSSNKSQVPLAGLPTMAWLHDRVYWRESARLSQLLRREPSSPLIGHCIDQGLRYDSSYTGAVRKSAESVRLGEWRWRQIIRVNEIPWLRGHKVQGQIVFPAAGYCVMAMDATSDLIKILCHESSTQTSSDLELDVIELQDVEFGRAVMLSEKNTEGIDILIRLHDIVLDGIKDASQTKSTVLKHSSTIQASFSIQAQLPAVGAPARLNEPYVACHGHLVANLRLPSSSVFTSGMPPYHDDPVHLHTISTTSIYDSYKVVGLEYTAPFQVDSLRRCLGRAKSTVRHANVTLTNAGPHDHRIGEARGEHTPKTKEVSSCFPVAALDNAFQTSLAAFASPGDGRLLAPYLPRTIGRLRVQLSAYRAFMANESEFLFDATIKGRSIREELRRVSEGNTLASWTATVEGLAFDPPPGVDPRPGNNQRQHRMIFQVEDLRCVNLVPSHGSYQEGIFCEEIWAPDPDDALRDFQLESDALGDLEGLETVEELAHYYMCNVYESFTVAEAFNETRTPWFIRRFWDWLHHRLEGPGGGPHSNFVNPWASDPARRSSLMRRVDRIKHRVEVQILEAVAANILRVMRQEDGPTILEVLFRNDMLARLYVEPAMYARANRYLGRVASLIAHRFPRCDILEVGAGTGGATQAMFTGLGGAYGSYTFTDISSGFFPQAKIKFADEVRRMIFKTLDIETDVVDQALTPATYDIIVASNVLHATRDIEASLKNVRKLLKPGGFLLLLEVTSVDKVLVPYLMGAVPGWWYFEDRWRKDTFSPLLTTERWHEVLQASGFQTGTEHIFRDMKHPEDHLSSVMVARATDEDWMAFRKCVPTSTAEFSANSLVIVKGKEENAISHGMALELKTRILGVCGDRVTVTIVDGLQTAAASSLLPSSMVIVLSDIESPLLGSPTSADWEALKIVFSGTSHDIFWVTSGRVHGRDPNQNMIVGLGRCARYENPGLRLRFIDVDDCTSSDAIQLISRIVWQTGFLSSKDASDVDSRNASWTNSAEFEMAIECGRLLLPRLVPLDISNQRYIVRRDGVVHDEEPNNSCLTVLGAVENFLTYHPDAVSSSRPVPESGGSLAQLTPPLSTERECFPVASSSHRLSLTHSRCVQFYATGDDQFYVSLGQPNVTALGDPEKSIILTPRRPKEHLHSSECALKIPLRYEGLEPFTLIDQDVVFLSVLRDTIAAGTLCRLAVEAFPASAAIMVVEPNYAFEVAISELAQEHNMRLYVVTARETMARVLPGRCGIASYIHPCVSTQRLRSLLRRETSGIYVDWASIRNPDVASGINSDKPHFLLPNGWFEVLEAQPVDDKLPRLKSSKPEIATMLTDMNSDQPYSIVDHSISLASRIVQLHLQTSSDDICQLKTPTRVAFSDATIDLLAKDPQILDWSLAGGDESPTGQLSNALLPNPACLFSPKKTYLFAGITSDLGLSVAKWMVQNGARSVALASRAPNIPKVWLEEMKSLGATDVRSFSMDVTDANSVKDVCDCIRDSMYPVAGVVFGAMVLNDNLLENMSFQTLQATMAPKVRGTYLVEQYFHDTDLDFFIFMSSMSAIVGIRGQSNYCAGNMYGRAVVADRRARGLAASTVDLSTVFGVGYFANAGASSLQTVHANLRGFNTLAIGEGDVLDAFHEAILRGPPNASATGDVIVGLGSETAVAIDQPPVSAAWHKDPRFGHFTARAGQKFDDRAAGGSAGGTSDMAKNVREKLSKTTTDEERLATLSSCFSAQIQDTMQLSSSSLRADVPLMDLGIDSLVAVDLRAWFFKELEVTVPVLSILNGESVRDLCKVVLSQV